MNTSLWADFDAKRRKAGGWWKDMNTLRVRLADNVLGPETFTVLEINVKGGYVRGVRIMQTGNRAHALARGPNLMLNLAQFTEWFSVESPEDEHPRTFRELWARGEWVGFQVALEEILKAFTTVSTPVRG